MRTPEEVRAIVDRAEAVGVLAVVLVASLAINVETTIVNAVLPTLNTDPTWLNLVHTVGADFAERSAEIVG